jgi:peptidyl-prolyl cis-trans isomerase SurA
MLNKIFYVLIILILNTNICLSESISLIINNKIITDSNIDDMTKIMLIKSGIKVNDTNINKFKFSAQNIFIKQHIKKNIIKKHLDYTDNINYNKIPIKILYEHRQDKYKWQNYIQETMNKQKYDQEKLNDYFNDIKGKKLRNISIIVIPWHNDRKKSYETIINIRNEIINGKDFGEMANIFSSDINSHNNGQMGWIAKKELVKKIDLIIWSMPVKQVSPPIKLNQSYVLIKVNDEKTQTTQNMGIIEKQYLEKLEYKISKRKFEYERNKLKVKYK